MAVTDFYPLLLGNMFTQPTDSPSFEGIAVVLGTVLEQFAQEFDIFICNQFGPPDGIVEVLVRQASLGKLHPPISRSRRATQDPTDLGLSFTFIGQQHDL